MPKFAVTITRVRTETSTNVFEVESEDEMTAEKDAMNKSYDYFGMDTHASHHIDEVEEID
jgi:hypothetical protein